eukprot:1157543-Pelagomonas_calceolata.AAC.15
MPQSGFQYEQRGSSEQRMEAPCNEDKDAHKIKQAPLKMIRIQMDRPLRVSLLACQQNRASIRSDLQIGLQRGPSASAHLDQTWA